MKFVIYRTSDNINNEDKKIIEVNSLEDIINIIKTTNMGKCEDFNSREIIVGIDKYYANQFDNYKETNGYFIEIYDDWRE